MEGGRPLRKREGMAKGERREGNCKASKITLGFQHVGIAYVPPNPESSFFYFLPILRVLKPRFYYI